MPIYEISHWSGGLSDFEDRGIPGSFKYGHNLDIRKNRDTLTCNQRLIDEGFHSSHSPSASPSPSSSLSASNSPSPSASPSPTPSITPSSSPSASTSQSPSTTASHSVSPSPSPSGSFNTTTVFQDLIYWFVKASDGYTYGFGDKGYIYRRDLDGFWLQVYKDPNGAIKGAEEKPSHGGKVYLEWCTDKQVNRKQLFGRDDWNDVNEAGTVQGDTWPKTNIDSAEWHTMKQVDGDVMIANNSFLAMSAYDDSWTNEALDVIPGNIIKTIVERKGRSIIGTYRKSDPSKGINAAIDCEVPLAQVGDKGEIYFANMVDSVPAKVFPDGGIVNPGGVTNQIDQVNFFQWEITALDWIDKQSVGNLALFAVYNTTSGFKGGIYSYGRTNKNKQFVLNLEHNLDMAQGVKKLGALASVEGIILVSYQTASGYGVKALDPNNKAEAVYEGLDFKAPIKRPIDITQWQQIEVFMEPLPKGCALQFWYKLDKTGDFIQAAAADSPANVRSSSFTKEGSKKAIFRMAAGGDIYEPRFVLTPNGNLTPEVIRARTIYL